MKLIPIIVLLAAVLPAGAFAAPDAANLVDQFAPPALRELMIPGAPVSVLVGTTKLAFATDARGNIVAKQGDLLATIEYHHDDAHNALWYQVRLENKGAAPIAGITIEPWKETFKTDLPNIFPRVQYLTGCMHYDGVYPSRAYQVVDRTFITNDHGKPVDIGGVDEHDYVPMMRVAMQRGTRMSGFTVAFESSLPWTLTAGFTNISFSSAPPTDFQVAGTMSLGVITLAPGQVVTTPKTHLIFFEGSDWTPLENATRKYIADEIAHKGPPLAQTNKVTYDHWFGIQGDFDVEDMIRQARKASELGCEYFCLDAGWYGKGVFGASGKGKWDEPDPVKFPKGIEDLQRLSKTVRDGGMGMGLWALLLVKNSSGEEPFDMSNPAEAEAAYDVLRRWIKTYDLTWFRFEMTGVRDLSGLDNYYQGMDRINNEFPNFHIECCAGGGHRFDLGNMRYCTSTWISDHTSDPYCTRFMQTGALRFWPSYMLNSAVRVHRKSGDLEATAFNVISRMPGTLSFNGDIAQWSPEATKRVRALVDKYKQVRHLQSQPVFFPFPQVQKIEDWDTVCFGDGTGEAQLLYAFNVAGPNRQYAKLPGGNGAWSLVMSSTDDAKIEPAEGGAFLTLPPNSCAVWKR